MTLLTSPGYGAGCEGIMGVEILVDGGEDTVGPGTRGLYTDTQTELEAVYPHWKCSPFLICGWPLPPSRRILKVALCREPPQVSSELCPCLPPPSSLPRPLQPPARVCVSALHKGFLERFYERECLYPGDSVRESELRDRGGEIGAQRLREGGVSRRGAQMSGAVCIRDHGAC